MAVTNIKSACLSLNMLKAAPVFLAYVKWNISLTMGIAPIGFNCVSTRYLVH